MTIEPVWIELLHLSLHTSYQKALKKMQPTESLNHLIIIYLFIHLVCGRVHVVQVGLLIL